MNEKSGGIVYEREGKQESRQNKIWTTDRVGAPPKPFRTSLY